MTVETEYLPPELFVENPSKKDLPPGHFPESWLKIEEAQIAVWQKALEKQVAERKPNQTEEETTERVNLIQHHFDEYFLEPSFEEGPYANNWHRNLIEILNRIIDLDIECQNLPEKDKRISFSSIRLEKRFAILDWLIKQIISSLPEGEEFTERQINDMFNNISQKQMEVLKQQIIDSGLLIQPLTSHERWMQTISQSQSM